MSARSRSAYTGLVRQTDRENSTGSIRNTAVAVKMIRSKFGCERQNENKRLRFAPFSGPCCMKSATIWTIPTSTFGNPTTLRDSSSASPASFASSSLQPQNPRRRQKNHLNHCLLWCKRSSWLGRTLNRNNSTHRTRSPGTWHCIFPQRDVAPNFVQQALCAWTLRALA